MNESIRGGLDRAGPPCPKRELSVRTTTVHKSVPRAVGRLGPGLWLVAALAASGCSDEEKTAPSVTEPPSLSVVHPEPRIISRVVGQPSFVQSYERTSIYPKVTAFIEKWNVDIGDKVRKGDVLADLFVPEMRETAGDEEGDGPVQQRPGEVRAEGGGGRRRRGEGGAGAAG